MDNFDYFLLILLMCLISVGIILISFFLKYTHTVVVKRITNNKKQVTIVKARDVYRDGVLFWRFRLFKKDYPPPPPQAVDVTSKGKLFSVCYMNENKEIDWIEDNGETNFFQPLNTNQRQILVNQIRKAQTKGKNWWKENIPMIVGLSFVVIVFISFMLFIGEGLHSLQEFTSSVSSPGLEAKKMDSQILDKLIQLDQDIQVIKSSQGVEDKVAPD